MVEGVDGSCLVLTSGLCMHTNVPVHPTQGAHIYEHAHTFPHITAKALRLKHWDEYTRHTKH